MQPSYFKDLLPVVVCSLDAPVNESEPDFTFSDFLEADDVDQLTLIVQRKRIAEGMSKLTVRERQVVTMRAQGLTLEQIGNRYGLSRERIRQIEADAHAAANDLPRLFGGHVAPLVRPKTEPDARRQGCTDGLEVRECLRCRAIFKPSRMNHSFCGKVCAGKYHQKKWWEKKKAAQELYEWTTGKKREGK